MIVTSWSQDGCDIRAPKRQEDEERAVPPHLLPFIRKTKSLPETPNRLPFKCSWLELCYVPPPTQHQLQGRLGMGVFSWAHCHIKQNQDYASKEERNWSWVDNKQCLPKTKGELWLLSFSSTNTHWAPMRCQTLCHVLWHLAFASGYPEFKEWSFFTGVNY